MIPYWTFPPTILLCTALGVLLASCAEEPYWIKVREPILVTDLRFTPAPCGKPENMGCSIYYAHRIELRSRMSPAQTECTFHHEMKHFAGYTHPYDRPAFALDCGDGELL